MKCKKSALLAIFSTVMMLHMTFPPTCEANPRGTKPIGDVAKWVLTGGDFAWMREIRTMLSKHQSAMIENLLKSPEFREIMLEFLPPPKQSLDRLDEVERLLNEMRLDHMADAPDLRIGDPSLSRFDQFCSNIESAQSLVQGRRRAISQFLKPSFPASSANRDVREACPLLAEQSRCASVPLCRGQRFSPKLEISASETLADTASCKTQTLTLPSPPSK